MQRSVLSHAEMQQPLLRPRLTLGAKGFRPFFLLAAAFAVAIIPLWLLILTGVVPAGAYLAPPLWHAHEMVFGFAVAVIAGFLLTAVGNWTQRETVVGSPLLALAALWTAGRVAIFFGGLLPRGVPAFVDLAFLPLLAIGLARPLIAARNRRNFVMLAILGALFAANVVVHLEALGLAPIGSGRHACLVAVDIVVLVILIIAGRVFPMFTRNATEVPTIRSRLWLDVLTVAAMALLTVLDVLAPDSAGVAVISGAVGVLALARAWRWRTRKVAHHPLLWVLHIGYAWIPVGLLLRALAGVYPAVPGSAATHALTVGAIGSVTLGMMARVALGHTGRPLVAPRAIVWAFVAATAAALARVFVPLLAPSFYLTALLIAGALWTLAFLLYSVVYAPILTAPRVDGKAG